VDRKNGGGSRKKRVTGDASGGGVPVAVFLDVDLL